MLLNVLGCTRTTLAGTESVELSFVLRPPLKGVGNLLGPSHNGCMSRVGDRCLQLSTLNEEYLVSAGHQPVLIASLPLVHTARRCY